MSDSDTLLTTQEAARLLGVGTTSIKRWADTGVLECVRTLGGHRRFPRDAVAALGQQAVANGALDEDWLGSWLSMLGAGTPLDEVVSRIQAERDEHGGWWDVAERLGLVITEIGAAWSRGEVSVIEEHIMSERLARALGRCADLILVPDDAPLALLITAEGEEHTLGLALVELCLREAGWMAVWAGRRSPIAHVEVFSANAPEVRLIGVSASAAMQDAIELQAQASALANTFRPLGVRLLLGGSGAWPEPPPYGDVVRTFPHLRQLLESGA